MSKASIPNLVRAYRVLQGTPDKPLSQRSFAEIVGVSRTTICNWEAGTFMPDIRHLLRLTNEHSKTWVADAAQDMLHLIAPESYSPAHTDLNAFVSEVLPDPA